MICEFWSARTALKGLKEETLGLVRLSREAQTMRDFLHCYGIFELTEKINTPWESHPGRLIADLSAFVDLEIVARRLLFHKDPDPIKIYHWADNIAKFAKVWKLSLDNQEFLSLVTDFTGPKRLL